MKKVVLTSVIALAALVLSQDKARAWHEFRFSAGFDIQCKGGGNKLLWGLWESSPGPGCYLPCQPHCGPASMPQMQVPQMPCVDGGMPVMSGAAPCAQPAAPAAVPAAAGSKVAPASYTNPVAGNPYAGYYYGLYGNYSPASQAPSYWYGN